MSQRADSDHQTFAHDVARSLTQTPRQLSSRYLYDELGSSLFEAICHLPWYRIARTERRQLEAHGREIFERLGPVSTVVEFGPGNGEKLLILATARPQPEVAVHLVDVSSDALAKASRTLGQDAALTIMTHQMTYETGLATVRAARMASGSTLVAFLGSNIGNFDPHATRTFLRAIREALQPRDGLLLGADLVKTERELLLAYDDPIGVTAAFNRNLLVRINRELGADFDVRAFAHRAVWNAEASRVEMQLLSRRRQRVRIPASHLDIVLEENEPIWTESSYKYRPDELRSLLTGAGFATLEQWIDEGFTLTLAGAH